MMSFWSSTLNWSSLRQKAQHHSIAYTLSPASSYSIIPCSTDLSPMSLMMSNLCKYQPPSTQQTSFRASSREALTARRSSLRSPLWVCPYRNSSMYHPSAFPFQLRGYTIGSIRPWSSSSASVWVARWPTSKVVSREWISFTKTTPPWTTMA